MGYTVGCFSIRLNARGPEKREYSWSSLVEGCLLATEHFKSNAPQCFEKDSCMLALDTGAKTNPKYSTDFSESTEEAENVKC